MIAAALGCLGLLLASVGIYGVVAHLVGQRTQEIGVRMALGADRGAVLALVFRQALKPLLWEVPAGLIGSALVSTSLGKMMIATDSPDLLYGVSPWSPVSCAGVILLLILVVWAASWVLARRAMRIDPSEALRYG